MARWNSALSCSMRRHSSTVRPAELTRKPRSHRVREKFRDQRTKLRFGLFVAKQKQKSRSEYGKEHFAAVAAQRQQTKSLSRTYFPPAAVLQTLSGWTSSASSHNCRSVSCALAPLSNSFLMRSRWVRQCGPRTESGVTGSSIFLLGRKTGYETGARRGHWKLRERFRRVPRYESGSLLRSGTGRFYRLRFCLSWRFSGWFRPCGCTSLSGSTTSSLIFGKRSTVYSRPR